MAPLSTPLMRSNPASTWALQLARAVLGVLVLGYTAAAHAGPFDPALRFRTLRSDHFVVYFHQTEDHLADRLAVIAEQVWRDTGAVLGSPPALTHVVLVDQTELANGSAFPLPYNSVVVTAAWPSGSDFVGNTDDWLRLVFTHEFAHIVHLDQSRGWARVVRGVFGRVSLAFPNLFLPAWQIEGVATYAESLLTGAGRLYAGDFRAVELEAARGEALEPLDRVNGGLIDWPGAEASYAYGLGFHAYLADRFGEDSLAALNRATAGRLPYTGSRAFRRVFGQPLGGLWRDYQAGLAAAANRSPLSDPIRRLTTHGFTTTGPRFAPPTCEGCPEEIVYSLQTPHAFPSIQAMSRDGSHARQLSTRYLGRTSGVHGDIVVFDQQELRRNAGLFSDLYVLDRVTGRVQALTSEARLLDPDVSPDGLAIVCVREGAGKRDLVVVRPAEPVEPGGRPWMSGQAPRMTTLISELDTQFNAPRWSPDGRLVVVERHARGALSEVVIVDAQTAETRLVASSRSARIVTPEWRPDGQAIVAAADFDGSFNLFEFVVGDALPGGDPRSWARQVTHMSGGATWPDVSPDGRTIAFVGYTSDGFDVFTMPYPPQPPPRLPGAASREEEPAGVARQANGTQTVLGERGSAAVSSDSGRTDAFSPWPTLRPTFWAPIVELDHEQFRLGAFTGGTDVLGYHAYSLAGTWNVSRTDAVGGARAAADWRVAYSYARWQPNVFASVSSTTAEVRNGSASDGGVRSSFRGRERELQAGVVFPFRRVRASHFGIVSLLHSIDEFPAAAVGRRGMAARVGWAISTAKIFGYSVSPEAGRAAGAALEVADGPGAPLADATTVIADGRVYVPGLARHHVVALRVAGGVSAGDPSRRRVFSIGGGSPNLQLLDFGRDALSLLRGFPSDSFAGNRAAIMNADYRWPLARPQRGVGTWPMFLRTLHAAVFADAGHAWTHAFRLGDVKTSVGGELSLDIVAGYLYPLTVTLGAGWGHDGERPASNGGSWYMRVGRAF